MGFNSGLKGLMRKFSNKNLGKNQNTYILFNDFFF
jgi:hypothetical protein